MIASKHIQFVVLTLGCLLAIYVGANIVTLPPAGLMMVLAALLVLSWTVLAGTNWWVPIFSGAAILGTFHVGFKIYPYEIGFGLATLGLLPLVLVQDSKAFQSQRKSLPVIFYLTALYLGIRLLIDVVPATESRGSLFRVFFSFTWCFLFAFLFHNYGSLSATRKAIGLMFVLLLIRAVAALIGFFLNIPLYIPGVNYVLSFSAEDSLLPMREVAVTLLIVSLLVFHSSKSLIAKISLLPVFAFAGALISMGAGRFQTLVALLIPLAFLTWTRRWISLLLVGALVFAGLSYINVVPNSLEALPPSAGRALSGLVFTRNISQSDFATASSDEWHAALRWEAYRRLTQSPISFLFGDGISPSPDLEDTMYFYRDPATAIQNAANQGAYENGLCNVLGLTGTVGFALYTLLFITFWKDTVPYFLRRPKGTFWEGMVFWGCFTSFCWFLTCYFEGGPPGFPMLLMVIAWDVVNEGKLSEEATDPETKASYRSPVSLSYAVPASIRE